jgi:type III pantothenate kinase
VVVDFGTAISLSVVSPQGAFVGGLIAPGPGAMLLGLQAATPRLPTVELAAPSRFLHRQTRSAIQAGVAWQVIGGVREMVRGLVAESVPLASTARPPAGPPLVLATGGGAPLFGSFIAEIHEVVPDLTLEGLFLAYRHPG